jgi:hypothetical protein
MRNGIIIGFAVALVSLAVCGRAVAGSGYNDTATGGSDGGATNLTGIGISATYDAEKRTFNATVAGGGGGLAYTNFSFTVLSGTNLVTNAVYSASHRSFLGEASVYCTNLATVDKEVAWGIGNYTNPAQFNVFYSHMTSRRHTNLAAVGTTRLYLLDTLNVPNDGRGWIISGTSTAERVVWYSAASAYIDLAAPTLYAHGTNDYLVVEKSGNVDLDTGNSNLWVWVRFSGTNNSEAYKFDFTGRVQ